MGALRRAARYLMRKPGKTAILVLIVFAASFSSMASAGIIETTAALSSDIKSQAMPSVGVYRDDGGLLGQDVADTLRAMRGVESCNRMGQLDAFPDGFSAIGSAVPDPGWEGAVRVNAYDDLSQGSPFEGQLLRLTEGRLFEPGDAGVVLIHSDLAEANGVSVGDEVGLSGDSGQKVVATVIGTFVAAGGNEGDQALSTSRNMSFNQIYADIGTAMGLGMAGFSEIRVDPRDPDDADELAESVSADLGGDFAVEVFSSEYDKVAPSLDSASSTASGVLALAAATFVSAVSAVLALWGRERVRERSVLMSLGASKASIVGQAAAEALAVAACAVVAASAVSLLASPALLSTLLPLQAPPESLPVASTAAISSLSLAIPVIASSAVALLVARRSPVEMLSERS